MLFFIHHIPSLTSLFSWLSIRFLRMLKASLNPLSSAGEGRKAIDKGTQLRIKNNQPRIVASIQKSWTFDNPFNSLFILITYEAAKASFVHVALSMIFLAMGGSDSLASIKVVPEELPSKTLMGTARALPVIQLHNAWHLPRFS
jgi:hypothetical protein